MKVPLFKKGPERRSAARAIGPADSSAQPDVVWGGQWLPIEPSASQSLSAVAVRETRRLGAACYVTASSGQDYFLGVPLTTGQKSKAKAKGFLSAQLLASVHAATNVNFLGHLATPQSNDLRADKLCFIGSLDSSTFVFCASVEGLPTADVVGDAAMVRAACARFEKNLEGGGLLLLQATPAVLGQFSDLAEANARYLREVAGLPFDAQWRDVLKPLQTLGSPTYLRVAGGLALLLSVALGGYLAYTYFADQALRDQRQGKSQQKSIADKNRYLQLQRDALVKVGSAIARESAMPLWRVIGKSPVTRQGFNLTSVICSVPSATCELRYKRALKVKTFADFVGAHGKDEQPSFNVAQLEDAVTTVSIPGAADFPQMDLVALKPDAELLLKLGSTAQRVALAGIKLSFTPPTAIVLATAEVGISAHDLRSIKRLQGTWRFEGPSDTFVAAMQRLPESATIGTVELALSQPTQTAKQSSTESAQNDQVIATGHYYVSPDPVRSTGTLR